MAKAKKYNKKKMEAAVDFGNITVPTKWEDVTLQMMSDYLKLSSDKEEQKKKDEAEAKKNGTEFNENCDKYLITDKDLLSIFTDFDMEKYDILPVELYESIMSNFNFVLKEMETSDPTNEIEINGMEFIINDKETLKVKEYEDAELVLRTDRFDYPSLLAILCREVTGIKTDHVTGKSYKVNEVYDSEFANKKFDGRREMFANMPITKVMPLITFFFLRGMEYSNYSQMSIQTIASEVLSLVENMEDSARRMVLLKPSMMLRMIKLRKLKKSIKCFL